MTTSFTTMMRLGLRLTGRNVDLGPAPGADSEESEESEESESGSGDAEEEEEEGEDASDDADDSGAGKGAGDDDEESDDASDGSDDDGSDDDGSDDDGSDDDGEGNDPDDVDDGHETELPDMPGDESDDDEGEDGPDAPGTPGDDGDGGDDSGDSDGGDDEPDGDTGEAGGHNGLDETSAIADSLLDAMEVGVDSGLTDNNDALGDAVGDESDESDDMLKGEAAWRPLAPDLDEVRTVRESGQSRDAADRMRKSVRRVVSSLSAKLRSKFLQARTKRTLHGVPVGEGLSSRRLVDSMVEIRAGRRPKRPDYRTQRRPECSLAAAIIIDQSGSMGGLRVDAARAAIALAEPLDRLGAPCLVVGPRNGGPGYKGYGGYGSYNEMYDESGTKKFHRDTGVIIDVFKDWDEPMTKAVGRFGKVQACGSTPLSDGIQYALQSLSGRKEVYRVIYVITDGWPDNQNVVNRQIRIAAEQGVTVVGVGISSGCGAVKGLFPVHVAVHDLEQLPSELLRVLDSIMFPSKSKRLKLDGPKFKKAM